MCARKQRARFSLSRRLPMQTTAPALELNEIEKLREEELEEARAIESVMLPAESLRAGAVTIGHQCRLRPLAAIFSIISN